MPNGAKNWCGTIQVQTETEINVEEWFQRLLSNGTVNFAVGQLERGTHLHVQCYLQMMKRTTLKGMKAIDGKAHWEIAHGTAQQNVTYCTKEETRVAGPWQVGTPLTKGQRTDLERAAELLDQGRPMREVAVECKSTFIRYHRGLHAYQAIISSAPRSLMAEGPEVWVFWGDSGTGKSWRAETRWPDAYRKPPGKWWDGYCGQETVILDDFKGDSMRLHDFQLMVDRYPLKVEFKGGYVELSAKRYVFTSNVHPSEWYSAEADPHGTVMRRINEFCADRCRLIHCVGWEAEVEAEVAGNTEPATMASGSTE